MVDKHSSQCEHALVYIHRVVKYIQAGRSSGNQCGGGEELRFNLYQISVWDAEKVPALVVTTAQCEHT